MMVRLHIIYLLLFIYYLLFTKQKTLIPKYKGKNKFKANEKYFLKIWQNSVIFHDLIDERDHSAEKNQFYKWEQNDHQQKVDSQKSNAGEFADYDHKNNDPK